MLQITQVIRRLVTVDLQVLIALGIAALMIAICAIAVIGGASSEKERMTFTNSQLKEHELVMKNVKITRTVPDLRVNYMIETARLTQYPKRGLSELVSPVLTETYTDGRVRVIKAGSGTIVERDNSIKFDGDVEVVEYQMPENTETKRTNSSELTVAF